MNIIWLGHSSFRIEIGNQVLLVDPWLESNPMLPAFQREKAISGATHILVSHGHAGISFNDNRWSNGALRSGGTRGTFLRRMM